MQRTRKKCAHSILFIRFVGLVSLVILEGFGPLRFQTCLGGQVSLIIMEKVHSCGFQNCFWQWIFEWAGGPTLWRASACVCKSPGSVSRTSPKLKTKAVFLFPSPFLSCPIRFSFFFHFPFLGLASNSWVSYPGLPSAAITGLLYHTWW